MGISSLPGYKISAPFLQALGRIFITEHTGDAAGVFWGEIPGFCCRPCRWRGGNGDGMAEIFHLGKVKGDHPKGIKSSWDDEVPEMWAVPEHCQPHWPYRKWVLVGSLPKIPVPSSARPVCHKGFYFPGLGPLNRTDADVFLQFMLRVSPWQISGCSQWVVLVMNRAQSGAVQLGIVWCCFIEAFVKCCDRLCSEIKNMLLTGCADSLLQVLGKICLCITMKKQKLPDIPSVWFSWCVWIFYFAVKYTHSAS